MSAIKLKRPLAILLVYYLSVLSTSLSAWSSLDYTNYINYLDESSAHCTTIRVIDEQKKQDEANQSEEEEEPDCD